MSQLYEIRNLEKYYGQTLVLAIPAFSLDKGAALTLQGANGSGKSTFLRILAFLEQPSSGEIKFYGGYAPRRQCTLLLQEPWLMRSSVYANVILGLKLRGISTNVKEKYRAAMLAAGFQQPDLFADRRPSALSGGEKARVALAARLILQPDALLLDEPTAHVDANSRTHIIRALRTARLQGATIICATHDDDLAEALGAARLEMRKPG